MKTDFKRPFTVEVADRNGGYTTNSCNGQRASSTSSARAAVERLADKLLGDAWEQVNQLGHAGIYWEIVPDAQVTAVAWLSGRVDIGEPGARRLPGAIAVCSGPLRAVQRTLGAVARHGQGASDGMLLVPGVPEGEGEMAKMGALLAWLSWCAKRNGLQGVVFHAKAEEVANV